MKPYRERTTNDFCEHWYYSQASYKGDHELESIFKLTFSNLP